jgi:hypothetical protein
VIFWSIAEGLGGSECVSAYVECLYGSVPHLKLAKITMIVTCLTRMPVLYGKFELTVGFHVELRSIHKELARLQEADVSQDH